MTIWVGMDVGETRTDVCVIDESGAVLRQESCNSDIDALGALLAPWSAKIGLIAIEAGVGTHLVRKLRSAEHPVELFEARQVRNLLAIYRNKTDRNDAHGLAEVARLGRMSISRVSLKTLEAQRLRTWLTFRHQLVAQRMASESSIRSLLSLHGASLGPVSSSAGLAQRVAERLTDLDEAERANIEEDVSPMVQSAISAREHIKGLDNRLLGYARAHDVCSRFLAIPGVGPICAVSFLSAVEKPERFRLNHVVGSYLGLTPRLHESGRRAWRPRISKMGNAMTRGHLIMSAWAMLSRSRSEAAIRIWGLELAARSGHRRARIAVARKLAVLMLAMWKNGTEFDPSKRQTFAAT